MSIPIPVTLQGIPRTIDFFFSFPCLAAILLLPAWSVFAQDNSLPGQRNQVIRLNFDPAPDLLGGAQPLPYDRMAAFLANSFQDKEPAATLFIQDSSLCSTGLDRLAEFEENFKATYAYTDEGQIAEMTFYTKINDESWQPFSRKQYTYQDQLLNRYLYQTWNTSNGSWQDRYEERMSYNNRGARTGMIARGNPTGLAWTPLNRDSLIYNNDGNLVRYSSATWENVNWTPAFRREATYNEEQQPLQTFYEQWTGSNWDTLFRESNTYDSLGFIWTGYLLEEKKEMTGTFQPVMRESYGYNLNGFWETTTRQSWNTNTMTWENSRREELKYNNRGIWTEWLRQTWAVPEQEWENNRRRRFSLNTAEGIQTDITQEWNPSPPGWNNASLNLAAFDRFGHLVREAGTQTWDPATASWKNRPDTRQCFHYWSEQATTSITTAIPQVDCYYPNPYNAGRSIECPALDTGKRFQLRLTDMSGRIVYDQTIVGGQVLSIDRSLPFGLYSLTIAERGAIHYSGKIIIQP